jgi:serine/threonine protein kinase
MNSGADFWVGPASAPDTYQLVAMLGGGGEGDVWKAVLPLSDAGRRQVAVKIMRGVGTPDEDAQWGRFGHLLQSLAHPGLVRVTGVFTGPAPHRRGEPPPPGVFRYVVMDFVEGVTLREWIDENPDARAAARLAMLRTVAAALDEMHSGAATEVPVAHGDVKPANIVVRPDGGTVLVDLGLARLADAAGMSGRSNPYAAPELRGPGAQATPEADAFAFAATAAQVLTGQPLPTDAHGFLDLATLQRLLNGHPVTARRPMLVRQILSALGAPPEARPRQLSLWLAGATDTLSQVTTPSVAGPAQAPPAGPGASDAATALVPRTAAERTSRRKGFLIGAAVLVMVLAGGGVAFALTSGGKKHSPHANPAASTTTQSPSIAPTDSLPPTDSSAPTGDPTDSPFPTDVPPTDPPTDTTDVNSPPPSTMQWVSDFHAVDYDRAASVNGSPDDYVGPYKTNGTLYGHSLGVSPGCYNQDGGDFWIEYDLSRTWSTMSGVVGVSDDSPDAARVTWRVYGDAKLLASGVATLGAATHVHVSVNNVLRLRLWINDPRSAQDDCNVARETNLVWGNLQLTAA